jgi:hypothetical protein
VLDPHVFFGHHAVDCLLPEVLDLLFLLLLVGGPEWHRVKVADRAVRRARPVNDEHLLADNIVVDNDLGARQRNGRDNRAHGERGAGMLGVAVNDYSAAGGCGLHLIRVEPGLVVDPVPVMKPVLGLDLHLALRVRRATLLSIRPWDRALSNNEAR